MFFKCPGKSSQVFRKRKSFVNLSGTREEKICIKHFKSSDFVKNIRRRLKRRAVPTQNLPLSIPYVTSSGRCCIFGCRAKKNAHFFRFPEGNLLQMWIKMLHMKHQDVDDCLRVCERHFADCDFIAVKSMYLKPHAIPSLNVNRLILFPRHRMKDTTKPSGAMRDHSYHIRLFEPRSNRMCSVYGCHSRAGNNVSLHRYPNKIEERYSDWICNLNQGKNLSSNMKVCSKHFVNADFMPGSLQ
ncbi:uncharacterized protein LOC131430034 isoform X2 [Malaya genurostris]|nr:uncharacterized protein LOC131430034 isoform X2 [Malaya genurostris]